MTRYLWFLPMSVHAFDVQRNQIQLVFSVDVRQSHDGVQWCVDVGEFVVLLVEQVSQQAANDGLVGDDHDIVFHPQTIQHGSNAFEKIPIRFAFRVTVKELVVVPGSKFSGEALGDLLVSHSIADTRVQFVEGR